MTEHSGQPASRTADGINHRGEGGIESCQLLRSMVHSLPEAIAITSGDRLVYVNPEFTQLFGYTADQVAGQSLQHLLVPKDRQHEAAMMLELVRQRGRVAVDTVRMDARGNPVDVSIVLGLFTEPGHPAGLVASYRDIRGRRQSEARLQHFALHDILTGLPNRALFLDRLKLAMARRSRRKDLNHAVMFVDLDRFKDVNDSHGHAVGDALLVEVANRLRGALRPHDTAARLSGDEFALLLDNLRSMEDLRMIADRILQEFVLPFRVEGKSIPIGASIGVAMCADDHQLPEHLLRDADYAMYRAKQQGGLRCEVFDSQMQVLLIRRSERESEMRALLDRRDYAMWYQPYYQLNSGLLQGFESLLRWRRQNGTFEPLRDMLQMADDSGMAMQLNRETLLRSCEQLQDWSQGTAAGSFTLSLNVSARQFYHPEMVGLVSSVLEARPIDPHRLIFEISESTLNETPREALRILERLAERGVQIAVDNFGAQLAPLGTLLQLPLDLIKLDRELVVSVTQHPKHLAALRSITDFSHSLGLRVIAQGVEEQAQMDALRAAGCDMVQGYLFAPAVEPSMAADLLARGVWQSPIPRA